MNDYSKIIVKVILTLLENISALFLLFYFIWPDFVSFRFVSQNSISRAHMQLFLFTHWFHFIELGKKIRTHGYDFEDVISAYRSSRNPMKDVMDLIGQLEALTVVKYSPRWYDILERNGRQPYDNWLFTCEDIFATHGGVVSWEKNSSLKEKDPFASFGTCSRHSKIRKY